MQRRRRGNDLLGHDAFLDIVANLVGILIILVVILGARSQETIKQAEAPEVIQADDQLMGELAQQYQRAVAAQQDSIRLEQSIRRYDGRISAAKQQRGLLLDLLSQAEAAWEEAKQELDESDVAAAEQQRRLRESRDRLDQLRGQREALENQAAPVVALEHLPTPMAKTVFGDEIHFRLKGNRLSLVPIDALMEEIRSDFQRSGQSTRQGLLRNSVGPIRGYVAHYAMEKGRKMVSTGGRVAMASYGQLVGVEIEALNESVSEPMGQPIDVALGDRSFLDVELAGRDAPSTTITVWVYPNSYAAFRRLKEHLYRKGFATAARPLPADGVIAGSPRGSRSSAQ
ncbi:MAG: hypothetical protein AAGA03_18640 [Planctomycetota bacterium]